MRERIQAAAANLQELIDALEMQNDESSSYFCLDTGEVYILSYEVLWSPKAEAARTSYTGLRKRRSEWLNVSSIVIDIDSFPPRATCTSSFARRVVREIRTSITRAAGNGASGSMVKDG